MARRQSNTVEDFQDEFRDQLARHYLGLPGRKPFQPPVSRDGLSLAVEVVGDEADQLRVIEGRNPLVYAANLSVSFRNQPRLKFSQYKFDWVFQEEEEEARFTNIGVGLINLLKAGGTPLFFSVGKLKRKQLSRKFKEFNSWKSKPKQN